MAKFKPGESGNPSGRPRGIVTQRKLRESISKDVPSIIAAMTTAAKGGDVAAARLLMDKVLPSLKPTDQPIQITLPDSLAGSSSAVLAAVAAGEITPAEASTLLSGISAASRVAETEEIVKRLEALEQRLGGKLGR